MSERTIPTLEEIAAGEGHRFDRRTIEAELAAVLIVHRRRLDALEVGRSGDGEVPHLPGSWCEHGLRREDDPQWRSGMAQCAQCAGSGDGEPNRPPSAVFEHFDRLHGDPSWIEGWRQRAEAAERERDEMRVLRDESAALVAEYREWREEAEIERDAARADVERLRHALRRIASLHHVQRDPAGALSEAIDIAADALKETPRDA